MKKRIGTLDEFINEQNEIINEGRKSVTIKRKYTENYHRIGAGKYGPIREKILSYIREREEDGGVTLKELKEFISGMNEDIGSKTSTAWIYKNKNYLKKRKVESNSESKIFLSKLGNRVLDRTIINEENIHENFKVGDRVTIEYEPGFIDYGTIEEIKNKNVVVVNWDDGSKSEDVKIKDIQLLKENLNESEKKIKKYKDVEVGDIAFENPDAGGQWNKREGVVRWKGTAKELIKSKYKNLFRDWDIEDDIEFEEFAADYDLVVVDTDDWGKILFNYNNDPSGVVVFEEDLKKMKTLLSEISGEPGNLSFKDFEEYIEDYTNNPEDYGIDLDSEYGQALLWAKSNMKAAYKLLK